MKRMVAKTDIVETVNKAIEDGEISAGLKLYKHTISFNNEGTIATAYFVTRRAEPYTLQDLYATAPNEAFLSWAGPLRKVTQISQSGPTSYSAYGVGMTGSSGTYALGGTFEGDTVTDY